MSTPSYREEAPAHRVIEPSVLYIGTPAYLVATKNPDGTPNLAPASSHFSLGRFIVLGLEEGGQSLDNVRRHRELTVNFPSSRQWIHVERLAGVTGKYPVPPEKQSTYTFEPRKFERADLSPIASDLIDVPRVREVPIQLEAKVRRITDGVDGVYGMVEAEVVRVHASEDVTIAGTDHIDSAAWRPLLYSYRHFYDRGDEVGWTRKNPLEVLPDPIARWEAFGGVWEIDRVTPDQATVLLRRCDGGEVAETLVSDDPYTIRWATVQRASQP